MTPAARAQAAIELLDSIIVAARDGGAAADVIATRYFRGRRYAGSADRRAIREIVWNAIRRFGDRPVTGRAALVAMADAEPDLAALFTGDFRAPPTITAAEPRAVSAPISNVIRGWLDPRMDDGEIAALLERAPLDLRINRRRMMSDTVLPEGEPLPLPIDGLRLAPDTRIDTHPAYLSGAFEIQDLASQWVAYLCRPVTGTVVDLCAGAGGKTLALAAAMTGEGRLIACDTDRARIRQLTPRAERAGEGAIECRLLDPGREREGLADLSSAANLVLVDAPCSGSGTWRRNPEARWRLTPERLAQLTELQARLLDLARIIVAPGGRIVYAVCSIISAEGEAQVEQFVARHDDIAVNDTDGLAAQPGRAAGAGRLLTPLHDGCDGFFVATLRRLGR